MSVTYKTVKTSILKWLGKLGFPTTSTAPDGREGMGLFIEGIARGIADTVPEGNKGDDGDPGAPGEDGISFIWRGEWAVDAPYLENDVVEYEGSSYIAIDDGVGHQPDEEASAYWELMAQGGIGGGPPHDPVTLADGCAEELSIDGQELSLAEVLTPDEHTGIGDGAPHHAQNTDTALGQMSADIDMNSHQITNLSEPDAQGEAIRVTATITEAAVDDAIDKAHSAVTLADGCDEALSIDGQELDLDLSGVGACEWDLDGSNYIVPAASHPVAPITNQVETLGVGGREWLTVIAHDGDYSGNIVADEYIQGNQLFVTGAISAASWGTAGLGFKTIAATYTDTSTAGAGTVASQVAHGIAQPTLDSTNAITVTAASTLYIAEAPAAGANTTITYPYAIYVASGRSYFDHISIGFNTVIPDSGIAIGGDRISTVAWGSGGIQARFTAANYTDDVSSGTVNQVAIIGMAAPTLIATNATVFTTAATLWVAAPVAGANVTMTNLYTIYAAGKSFFTQVFVGSGSSTIAHGIIVGGNRTAGAAWGSSGIQAKFAAATYTDDASAAGTVSVAHAFSIGTPTYAATDAGGVTYTNAATFYITNAPAAGDNVTITYPWAIWVDAGDVKFDGGCRVGSWPAGSLVGDLEVGQTTGGVVRIGRNDTSVTANDVIGQIDFCAFDASTATNNVAARIQAIAKSTISTDINPGILIFSTTTTGVGSATPTESFRILETQFIQIADAVDIVLNTTTGTKIGTGTTQKLAFHNAAPCIQASHFASPKTNYAAGELDTEAEIISAINALNTTMGSIITLLENKGLMAAS